MKKKAITKKKAFALRIDEDILKAVENWADDEFRSTNGQIEWMLSTLLREANRLEEPNEGSPDL